MAYALVTGASSGIGAAYARALRSKGYSLLLSGRRKDKLDELAAELIEDDPQSVRISLGDLNDASYLERLAQEAVALRVEFLVNNAGYGYTDWFLDGEFEMQYGMVETHCRAPMYLVHRLAPGMIAAGRGFIVNVSSLAGEFPVPKNTMYIASKAMLTRFTEGIALELDGRGIRVQALLPGFTYSDFHDRLPHFSMERKSRGLLRWQRPEQVVRESLTALKRGRIVHVSGWSNRLLRWIVSVIPSPLAYAISKRQAREL